MTTLLVLLCQSTALLALGLTALHLTRRRGPAVQTVVGRATLSGVALLLLLVPLSGRIAPVWRLPAEPTPVRLAPALPIRSNAEGHKREGEEVKTGVGTPLAVSSVMPTASASPSAVPAGPPQPVSISAPGAASSAPTLPPAAVPHPSFPNPSFRKDPATEERGSKAVGLPALLLFLWLAACRWHLVRLRRTASLIADGPAAALLAELTPTPPLLLTHPSVQSPFLAGTRRPAIFLPPTYAADFGPDALRAVFLHELAHRDRRDNLWTLAARVLTAVLWFQPLLWLLGRRLEQISEDACDQAVLAARCPPRAYAACLLSLAERPPLTRSQRTLTAGVAPFRSSVGRRISRILTLGVPTMPAVTLRLRLSIAALTLAAALGGAFLVSSAPAQIQPKPAPVVTPEMLKFRAEQAQDMANLKAISLALLMYERDNHYRFPDADKWMDQITPYLEQIALYRRDRSVFYDPFQLGKHRYGYAFNRNCSRKPLSALSAPASTDIVYESTLGTRNASDTGQSPFIHSVARPGTTPWTGSGYGFADGHAKWLRPNQGPYGDSPVSFALKGNQPTALSEAQAKIKADNLVKHYPGNLRIYGTLANGTTVLLAATEPNRPLNQAQFLAGLTPVQGPGVVVTLRDSKKLMPAGLPAGMAIPNIIHDTDINQVVNELKAAGAEAISVNNQRLVATSAVRSAGPTVYVNNTPQEPPYVIKAIGDPKALTGALNMPGGLASQITAYDKAMLSVQQAATLPLPAYTGGNGPRYARPVSAADPVQAKLDFLREVEAAVKQHSLAYEKQVTLTLDSEGAYFLDGVQLPEAQIKPLLAARARQNPKITAVIKCSRNQPYSRIEKLLGLAKQAGIKMTKITSLSSSPPFSAKPADSAGTTPMTARTHTIVGYGLVSFMLSKHLYCRAVEHSEAARLGISTEKNSEIVGVNGRPVPETAAQFVAICHAVPPLRLLLKPVDLKNFSHKTQLVTLQTKAPFSALTDAAAAEDRAKYLQSAQADAAKAKATLAHANEQLTQGVHALLPQATPATLAKALNLERQLGWSMDRMQGAAQGLAWSRKRHNPESTAKALDFERRVHIYLDPEMAEEARLFPQTANSRRQLAPIHVLAENMGNMRMIVTVKQVQAMVIASLLHQRSPDVTV